MRTHGITSGLWKEQPGKAWTDRRGGGHAPASTNEVIREVLDWLDLYLGPVDAGR